MKSEPRINPEEEVESERDDAVIAGAFRSSLAVIVGVVLVGAVAFAVYRFWPSPAPEVSDVDLQAPKEREEGEVVVPIVTFTDVTTSAGIDFRHTNGVSENKLLPETMGGGVAFFDYDNDGDPDLLFVNSCHWEGEAPADVPPPTSHLYANQGDGTFVDVTEAAGLGFTAYSMGVGVGDYDGDGWRDVYITAVGRNRLFRNVEGRFEDVTETAGVAGGDDEWSASAGWFDYDRDGRLDLFVANYIAWNRELNIQLKPTLDGKTRAYAPPNQFNGRFPYLFHNEGDGTFREVAAEAGMHVRNPDTGVPVPKALGVVFVDLDRDSWTDVVVANDTVPNLAFRNRGDGTFEEMGTVIGLAFDSRGRSSGAMGIDVGAHRDDGSLSIAIGNFSDEATSLYVSDPATSLFTDEALPTGLGPRTREELTFGVLWLDYDLDGRLDFLAANGHLENEISKIRSNQQYEQQPHLFWNAGSDQETELVSVLPEWCGEDLTRRMVGRALASADFDGDGDEDVVITGCGTRPRLLRNDQQLGHHWVRIRLRDEGDNWEALGSEVRAVFEGYSKLRFISPTRSYLSQSEAVALFGLGESTEVPTIEVRWPDGTTETFEIDGIDREIVLRRSEGTEVEGIGSSEL